ncbi:hypothetical protein NB231_06341 [Nitrococcus mobilis Nb-231]|uniref:Uncharacterized protein n=2 Tax=Nitrococcus mobilis TaxID=35797 RepID=A4BQY5_9GAMM|nr:hypothetical protein NB231_06341 [Nitrococcus mobilis Nb-231]
MPQLPLMNRLAHCFAIASLIILPLVNDAFGDCSMNADPDTVIIQWSSKGGLEKPASAMADLTVFADGRVLAGPRFANGTATEQQLSEADLAALRRFVFEKQDIWSIDSAAIERDLKALANSSADSGSRAVPVHPLGTETVADAATTVIRVRDGVRTHQVSQYNLFGAARRYPQIDELQRLRAIEICLLELADQTAAAAR